MYFFCDFAARKQQDGKAIVQSLLLQMIEQSDGKTIEKLQESKESTKQRPHLAGLTETLCAACKALNGIRLILDGIDELENTKDLRNLFNKLIGVGCKILIFSRDSPHIRRLLSDPSELLVQASHNDIQTYALVRLEDSDLYDSLSRKDEFVQNLVEKAGGL